MASRTPKVLRLGIVPYLNARPLIAEDPRAEWIPRPPVRLVRDLAAGRIDAGLLPSFACAAEPSFAPIGTACIASRGPVGSVRLFLRVPIGKVRKVRLDPDSVTSNALLKILCVNVWKIRPRFARRAARPDAILRIGDAGLRGIPGWRAVDLGEVWTGWTGLPFVWAAWTVRRGDVPRGLAAFLDRCARRGRARLGRIVQEAASGTGLARARLDRYLRREIRYRFGPSEKRGLRRFYQEARDLGLLGDSPGTQDSGLRTRSWSI